MQLSHRSAPRAADPPPAQVFLLDGRCGDRSLLERAVRDVAPGLVVAEVRAGPGAVAQLCDASGGRPAIVWVGAFAGVDRATATVAQLGDEPRLAGVPILVLGAFQTEAEVARVIRAGATSVIPASPFVDLLLGTMRAALSYWTHVAVLLPVPTESLEPGRLERRSETGAGVADELDAR